MRELCDVHCHLVPGVDDGVENLDMSMELIKMEFDQGVRKILVTPHYRQYMFLTPRTKVKENFDLMKATALAVYPDLQLFLGCEYHYNRGLLQMLREDPLYRLGGTYYVMLEFSEDSDQDEIAHYIIKTSQAGLKPVIAHLERYKKARNLDFIDSMRESGALVQVNADSLIGEDGFFVKRFCKKMLENGMIDLVGSDAHNPSSRPPRLKQAAEYIDKVASERTTEQIMVHNPERIFKEIESVQAA